MQIRTRDMNNWRDEGPNSEPQSRFNTNSTLTNQTLKHKVKVLFNESAVNGYVNL